MDKHELKKVPEELGKERETGGAQGEISESGGLSSFLILFKNCGWATRTGRGKRSI